MTMNDLSLRWRSYFDDFNEGLGTNYERFILHGHFEKIKRRYSVQSVLEAPSFGMTGISGINSMWWAMQGVPVTVMDDNQERLDLITRVWKDVSLKVELVFRKDFNSLPFADGRFLVVNPLVQFAIAQVTKSRTLWGFEA